MNESVIQALTRRSDSSGRDGRRFNRNVPNGSICQEYLITIVSKKNDGRINNYCF